MSPDFTGQYYMKASPYLYERRNLITCMAQLHYAVRLNWYQMLDVISLLDCTGDNMVAKFISNNLLSKSKNQQYA
jgi:hypothetical protein